MKHSTLTGIDRGSLKDLIGLVEPLEAKVRARVEHPFHGIKGLFHQRKFRYKRPAKNYSKLVVLFGSANLVLAKRMLLALRT